jgi:hypothetical protein
MQLATPKEQDAGNGLPSFFSATMRFVIDGATDQLAHQFLHTLGG